MTALYKLNIIYKLLVFLNFVIDYFNNFCKQLWRHIQRCISSVNRKSLQDFLCRRSIDVKIDELLLNFNDHCTVY